MIAVEKVLPLSSFSNDARNWYDEFESIRGSGPGISASTFWNRVRSRKAMKSHAQRLCAMFHDKCGYCESWIHHVSSSHIEHYFPKSRSEYEGKMFDWENWILCCPACNTKKGTTFEMCEAEPCLLNPVFDVPRSHIRFDNALISARTTRGSKTKDILQLNRSSLLDNRTQWLLKIQSLLILWAKLDGTDRNTVRRLLVWSMQDEAPYCAMVRDYLEDKVPMFAKPASPHAKVTLGDPITEVNGIIGKFADQLSGLS